MGVIYYGWELSGKNDKRTKGPKGKQQEWIKKLYQDIMGA